MSDIEITTHTVAELAQAAGISVQWTDAYGASHIVSESTLSAILAALDLPCETQAQLNSSYKRLLLWQQELIVPPLLTGIADQAVVLPDQSFLHGFAYRIELESGPVLEGRFTDDRFGTLELPAINEVGYHKLVIGEAQTERQLTLAIAPLRCFSVDDAQRLQRDHRRRHDTSYSAAEHMAVSDTHGAQPTAAKVWGLAVQLYSLRRDGDGGIGDFAALQRLVQSAAQHGASLVAISPVHAMFSADPYRYSPYGPSSRLFINVTHIDAAKLLGEVTLQDVLAELGASAQQQWQDLQKPELLDWVNASTLKLQVLRGLYQRFLLGANMLIDEHTSLHQFCEKGGEALEAHARFEALHAWMRNADNHGGWQGGWQGWPAEFHDPQGAAVTQFVREYRAEVDFHLFLQWQAAQGLGRAQRTARESGMCIGLISDLAVGADNGGSQAWSRQGEIINGLSVGAPPDLLGPLGQSWGLGAFSPHAMRAKGYRAYLEMLRAAFAHAGGVRIDHVLGLGRLWLVPNGLPASEGAYLHYPLEDLLRLIALESWRHQAIVIGEDLGTVPDGYQDKLAQRSLLGIQVLWFQRAWQRFMAPHEWKSGAMGTTGTHDLPTIAGWWSGRDIRWRAQLNMLGPVETEADAMAKRAQDREELWRALSDAGFVHGEQPSADAASAPVEATIAFLNATPVPIAILPIEDALALTEQPNLPGTIDTHPNWQRRLPQNVSEVLTAPEVQQRLARMNYQRSNFVQE